MGETVCPRHVVGNRINFSEDSARLNQIAALLANNYLTPVRKVRSS
jgi:hypothetical protein